MAAPMYQAIRTKWLGPTNTKGSRIVVTAGRSRRGIVAWDHSIGSDANHVAAARALAGHLHWTGVWFGGGLDDSGYAFVRADVGVSTLGAAFLVG